MNKMMRAAAGVALLLSLTPQLAAAESVNEARALCSSLKQQVRALENADADRSQISHTRREWERACVRANSLMNPGARVMPVAPMRTSVMPSAGPLLRYKERLSEESTAVFRGHRFKVTILDPNDEAARLAPPVTRPAASAQLNGKPQPLF